MELRLAKVDRAQLRSVVPELATLLEAYESNLAEAALTDWAGVLISAAEAVMSRDFAPSFARSADLAVGCAAHKRGRISLCTIARFAHE
jgi:hypothetical protein